VGPRDDRRRRAEDDPSASDPTDQEPPERRRGSLAFSQSDEFAVAIFDALAEGVLVVDHRGRIVAMNRSAERLLGYESSTLIGRDVRESPWVLEDESGRRIDVQDGPIIGTLDTGRPQGRLTVTVRPDGGRSIAAHHRTGRSGRRLPAWRGPAIGPRPRRAPRHRRRTSIV